MNRLVLAGVGICANQAGSVVTSFLMGTKLDVLSIENTIIHELGHNLGSDVYTISSTLVLTRF